jgi:hypothetical protein
MGELRWLGLVGVGLVLAGCGGGSGTWSVGGSAPDSSTSTPVVTVMPRPTPTAKPMVKPKPVVPEADCSGSFKDGMFNFSGSNIYISDQGFTCNGGQMVGYERHRTAITFYVGAKHVTLGPKKFAAIGGYRIRVGIANSKQATFTIDRITAA